MIWRSDPHLRIKKKTKIRDHNNHCGVPARKGPCWTIHVPSWVEVIETVLSVSVRVCVGGDGELWRLRCAPLHRGLHCAPSTCIVQDQPAMWVGPNFLRGRDHPQHFKFFGGSHVYIALYRLCGELCALWVPWAQTPGWCTMQAFQSGCVCVSVRPCVNTLTAEAFDIWLQNLVQGLTMNISWTSSLVKVKGQCHQVKNMISMFFLVWVSKHKTLMSWRQRMMSVRQKD